MFKFQEKYLSIFLFFLLTSWLYINPGKALANNEEVKSGDDNVEIDFEKIREEINSSFESDLEIKNKYRTYIIKEIDYGIWRLEFIKKSFEWQFFSGIIILLVVITLVFMGLYFSYIQFSKSITRIGDDSGNQEDRNTTIKVGAGEIQISSSVIGLIILALSFAFFYLYIDNVFPIKDLGLSEVNSIQTLEEEEDKDNSNP